MSIIFCPSFRDIYVYVVVFLSFPFVTITELFCCQLFETPVILLPIKSPVAWSAS